VLKSRKQKDPPLGVFFVVNDQKTSLTFK